MPSGNMTLLDAAKYGDDQHARGVIETIIAGTSVFELVPWLPFAGNALIRDVEGTLPDVQFRNVNESYSQSWGSDNQEFWGVSILGGEVKVDNFLVNVVGTRADMEAKQWAKMGKSNAMRWSYEFFNGTGSVASKGFKGLKTLIDEGKGQKLLNAAGGGPLSLDKADESLELFRNQGGPQWCLLNRNTRRQFTYQARTSVSGISLIDVGTDVFGKQTAFYDGVPFRLMEDVRDGSGNTVPALPFTEDPGDATSDTASLYWVKFGEDDVTGLIGHNGSFMAKSFGETEAAPQRLGRLEWYPGLGVFNRYSVVRLYGITAI